MAGRKKERKTGVGRMREGKGRDAKGKKGGKGQEGKGREGQALIRRVF